jgi:TatD DNase family protein
MRDLLVDSHCHLDRLDWDSCGGSAAAALARARENGVGRVLCISVDPENIMDVLALAEAHAEVSATVGVHPLQVAENPISQEALQQWARGPSVVGVGETGLDYYYDQQHSAAQRDSFALHLQVAAEAELPVVVHTREARTDTLALIREYGSIDRGGVLHCFTESWDMARQAMDLNYSISISGIVTFANAGELRDVVRKLPIDRLLVETDSPYLAPVPYRGKANQPAYVLQVAAAVAEIKGLPLPQVVEATTANYDRLFEASTRPAQESVRG